MSNGGGGGMNNGGGGGMSNGGGGGNRNGGGRSRRGGNWPQQAPQPQQDTSLLKQTRGAIERVGVIEIGGKPATVLGRDVQVGMFAPEFTVTANDWSQVDVLTQTAGKVRIIASVPSLDTNVCAIETRKFNEAAASLSEDIEIAVISTDMPMTQKRWCGSAGVDQVTTFSDVLNTDFGIKYGLLIRERRYLRRAVFVVDRNDKLSYVAYMAKLGDEPDYDEVIRAAEAALS